MPLTTASIPVNRFYLNLSMCCYTIQIIIISDDFKIYNSGKYDFLIHKIFPANNFKYSC